MLEVIVLIIIHDKYIQTISIDEIFQQKFIILLLAKFKAYHFNFASCQKSTHEAICSSPCISIYMCACKQNLIHNKNNQKIMSEKFPDVFTWIQNIPQITKWNTTSLSFCICH